MDTTTLKKSIAELIRGLSYSSESDYPLELLDWGLVKTAGVQKKITASCEDCKATPVDAAVFFNHYIQSRSGSADAARYKKLQDFLSANTSKTMVWRCGRISIDIFIVISAGNGHVLAIKTKAIET